MAPPVTDPVTEDQLHRMRSRGHLFGSLRRWPRPRRQPHALLRLQWLGSRRGTARAYRTTPSTSTHSSWQTPSRTVLPKRGQGG